jgi:CheY-like chemotaxis protein
MSRPNHRKLSNHKRVAEILIVDDNADEAELTVLALGHAQPPPRTLWLSGAQEALDYLTRKGNYHARRPGLPFLVLCDIHMPGMSGHDFVKHARARSTLRGLPIVILSGSADEADIAMSYRLGASGYLSKPMDLPTFTAQMVDVCRYWLTINKYPKGWISRSRTRRRPKGQ